MKQGLEGGEQVAPGLLQQAGKEPHQLLGVQAHDILEQVLLVLKVHVKAAPGDASLPDDAVDGGLVKGDPGKFVPGGPQQSLPLLRGEMKKGGRGQGISSLPYDKLSYSIRRG